ncbi:hypothetical protein MAPG_09295 [Magnaporthiopsis poae ATCC 64411]|uniref:DUF6594 domain-containing protein n=1 Tax=Magnaporthiopsis poae (strain ATCC 64411 / 73-15) TaxID=644358 RepID=A0A0C4E9K2_MAGP6|nr:hypothetical protein MAPG_09295 [Magnaporthiopsis poae ATCC 64411]
MAQPHENGAQPAADPEHLSAVARLMAKEEDWAIFRRFDELNLLNLLMLQEGIQELANQLAELRPSTPCDDAAGADSWYTLAQSKGARKNPIAWNQGGEGLELRRRETWRKIKEKLKEYNAALMDLARLRSLEPPIAQDTARLRAELDKMVSQSRLHTRHLACWDAAHEDDFAAIRSGTSKGGRFGLWVTLGLEMIRWELWRKHSANTDPATVSSRVVALGKKKPRISKAELARKHAFVSRFAMALFGGVGLIVPTVVMAKVQGIDASLITTSVAVVLFGLALAFGATDSTGKDVLAATAAYTAVLVVFVGTSLGGGASTSSAGSAALTNGTSVS